MKATDIKLYFLVLMAIAIVVVVGFGGGLWAQHAAWPFQWQHQSFAFVCHQLPDRSFWINGQPMAICSRCLGIYGAFLFGWLCLPLIDYMESITMPAKKLAGVAILLNLVDIVGNLVGFWENTLTSRFMLGCLVGLSAALFFTGTFFNRKTKFKRDPHGRFTATGV